MKKELSKYKFLIHSISKTTFFKIIFILIICLVFYGYLLGDNIENDYINSIIIPHSVTYFNIYFFLLLLLNTFNNYSIVSKNYNYLIRLENRHNLVKSLISVNTIINLIWVFVFFLLIVSFNTLFRFHTFDIITIIDNYGVSNIVYASLYLFRYYFFALLISNIFILLVLKFKEKGSYIFALLFLSGFLFVNNSMAVVNSFQILPWKYFEFIHYSSFMMEVSYSLLYCIILEVICVFLYNVNLKKHIFKLHELYFFLSDFEYFVKKNKLIFIIYFIIPLIISFLSNFQSDGNYVFQTSLGLNIDGDNTYILSVLGYCINIISCIYLFITSFIKDYSNITNIYLRYNYKIYYFIKAAINIFMIFLLKIIQYILLIGIIKFVLKKSCSGILPLFINDVSFIIFMGFLVLLFYILFMIFNKSKIFICILMLICFSIFILNPINICEIDSIYFFISTVFAVLITNYIIVKKNKNIIQEIGGI